MDCSGDKRLYLPSLKQVEDPLYTIQGRRYMIPKRPIRGKEIDGDQRAYQSIMMDTKYIRGVMVIVMKRVS
jgi:hypothetical protein